MIRTRLVVIVLATLATNLASAEDDLGRLFFTPAQRAALDAGKEINLPKTDKEPAKRSTPAAITLNGVVVRSDGERTVWINDRAYQGRDPEGLGIRPSAQAPAVAEIRIREERKAVQMRVGQTYSSESGKITEAYETPPKSAQAGKSAESAPKATDN